MEDDGYYHPLWETIVKGGEKPNGIARLKSLFEKPEKKHKILLSHRMLALPLRFFVIRSIKEPLRKVLILAGKRFAERFGEITKENTIYPNIHKLLDTRDKFLEYERIPGATRPGGKDKPSDRAEMFRYGWNLFIAECEHDRYYRYRFEWFVEELVKAILSGEWQPRLEGWPEPKYWKEPEPYGGEHSIIYKLQAKREEINKLLEEATCQSS